MTLDGLLDNLGQSQIMPYIENINSKKFRFYIISLEKNKTKKKEKIARYQQKLHQHNIRWYPISYSKNPPFISSLFNLLKIYIKIRKILKNHRIDCIHSRSYFPSLIALKIKKQYRIPFIFDMRGFWIDERVDAKSWNLNNVIHLLVYKFFKKKEKEFLSEACQIICLTNKAVEILKENSTKYNYKPISNNTTVIPCCVNTSFFDPNKFDKNTEKEQLGFKKEDYIVAYLGSFGTWYLLEEMMEAFKSIQNKMNASTHTYFLLITKENPQNILKVAKQYQINEKDIIIKPADRSEIPRYLSIVDIGIFYILRCFSKKSSSPVKMGEFLSMNIPIITNRGLGDIDEMLADKRIGILVDEPGELNEKELETVVKNEFIGMRKTAIELLNLKNAVNTYINIYEKIA